MSDIAIFKNFPTVVLDKKKHAISDMNIAISL